MNRLATFLLTVLCTSAMFGQQPPITMVIHGGVGTIERGNMTPERDKEYRAKLSESLVAGHKVLSGGGSSLDAIEAAIRILEDSPLFNAGKGSVFTAEGRNELDASIMDGRTRAAGAVAGVTIIKNPISAARAVMEKSDSVMLTGRGAELFATKMGLEIVDPSYFWTERRWKALQEELKKREGRSSSVAVDEERKFGTVGAVALDRAGNIAAGTSTGGRTGKMPGRIGDSPIIGAGTYADNETCGVSATGHGEFFIRWAVGHEMTALMRYRNLAVQAAADELIRRQLASVTDDAGLIALDRKGNVAISFATEGMYRGVIRADGVPRVAIYGDEELK